MDPITQGVVGAAASQVLAKRAHSFIGTLRTLYSLSPPVAYCVRCSFGWYLPNVEVMALNLFGYGVRLATPPTAYLTAAPATVRSYCGR